MKILLSHQAPSTGVERLFKFVVLLIALGVSRDCFEISDDNYVFNCSSSYQTSLFSITFSSSNNTPGDIRAALCSLPKHRWHK